MLLVGVKESGGWLISRWNLTYKVGWEQICKAVHSVYEFYAQPSAHRQMVFFMRKQSLSYTIGGEEA